MRTAVQERRTSPRGACPSRLDINVLQPRMATPPRSVNWSEGGLCLRLEDVLEVRSLVRFQLSSDARSVMCTGRVAWVIQRLDLRDNPPFLFDVGIEFVDIPATLRQWLIQRGVSSTKVPNVSVRTRLLEPTALHGRTYVPNVVRETNQALRWHLIVSVESAPCFSGRYASERDALAAWATFKRQRARR